MYNNPACKNANRHGIPFNLLPIANFIYFITCNFGKSAVPQYHTYAVRTSPLGPVFNDHVCPYLLALVESRDINKKVFGEKEQSIG